MYKEKILKKKNKKKEWAPNNNPTVIHKRKVLVVPLTPPCSFEIHPSIPNDILVLLDCPCMATRLQDYQV